MTDAYLSVALTCGGLAVFCTFMAIGYAIELTRAKRLIRSLKQGNQEKDDARDVLVRDVRMWKAESDLWKHVAERLASDADDEPVVVGISSERIH